MSKTWKGEHEWRCVRIYTGARRDFWEASLPYTAISTIILGANATDQTRTRLFKWADDMLGDNFCIEIRESVADRGAWMCSNQRKAVYLLQWAGNDAQVGKSHGLNDLMRRRVACESVGAQAAGIDISTYPDEFQAGPAGLPVGAEKTVCLLA
jgi:hypothetical protein